MRRIRSGVRGRGILDWYVMEEGVRPPRGHHFFIGGHNANGDGVLLWGNNGEMLGISVRIDGDPEKAEPLAHAGTDGARLFSDAAAEHECVEAAEHRAVRAQPASDAVTEELHRFRRLSVVRLCLQEIAHVTAPFRYAEESRFRIH